MEKDGYEVCGRRVAESFSGSGASWGLALGQALSCGLPGKAPNLSDLGAFMSRIKRSPLALKFPGSNRCTYTLPSFLFKS